MNKAVKLFDFPHFNAITDSFIGFNDLFTEMENAMNRGIDSSFPPYDIYTEENTDKTTHTYIKFALAGIPKKELRVEFDNHILKVYNEKSKDANDLPIGRKNIRLGIAQRQFCVTKQISESLSLVGAKYEDGCLIIEFKPIPKDKTFSSLVEIQ